MYHVTKVLIVFDRVCANPCALILMRKQQFQPEEAIYPLCFQSIWARPKKQAVGGPALCFCWEHSWEKRFLESLDSLLGSGELALKPSSLNLFTMTYLLSRSFTATLFLSVIFAYRVLQRRRCWLIRTLLDTPQCITPHGLVTCR